MFKPTFRSSSVVYSIFISCSFTAACTAYLEMIRYLYGIYITIYIYMLSLSCVFVSNFEHVVISMMSVHTFLKETGKVDKLI